MRATAAFFVIGLISSLSAAQAGQASEAKAPKTQAARTGGNQAGAGCPREKFRGEGAKARWRECLAQSRRDVAAREEQQRMEAERLRLELRERCAQDPRRCEESQAQMVLRLRDLGREGHAEGYSRD